MCSFPSLGASITFGLIPNVRFSLLQSQKTDMCPEETELRVTSCSHWGGGYPLAISTLWMFQKLSDQRQLHWRTMQYPAETFQGRQHRVGIEALEGLLKCQSHDYGNSSYRKRERQPTWESLKSYQNPYPHWAQKGRSTKHHQGCKRHMVSAAKKNKPQRSMGLNLPAASS